jgi:hypothetical protein
MANMTCLFAEMVALCSPLVCFLLRLTSFEHLLSVQILALHVTGHFGDQARCCLSHTRLQHAVGASPRV